MHRQMMKSLVLSRSPMAAACLRPSLAMSTATAEPVTKAPKKKKVKMPKATDPFLQQIHKDYEASHVENRKMHNELSQHFAENSVWAHPIIAKSAQGARFTDVDGHSYIDWVGGWGSAMMGHNNEIFRSVLKDMLSTNMYHVGTRSPLLKDASQLVAETTGFDKCYFFESGTKACHLALRVARAYRNKEPVVLFNYMWHGQSDTTLFISDPQGKTHTMSPGIPQSMTEHVWMFPYGSEEGLQCLRDRGEEIAAVMVEPIPLKFCEASSKEWLQALRDIADEKGFVLIFDEVVSGFRMRLGGAQEYYGIKADMGTYGKSIASGVPIGVLAGKSEIMASIGNIAIGGTFCSNTMQLQAVVSTIRYLQENKSWVYSTLRENMARYANTLNEAAATMNIPMKCHQFESIVRMDFDPQFQAQCLHVVLAFLLALRMRGVYHLTFLPYAFGSIAHTPEVIDEAAKIVVDTLTDFHNAGMFPTRKK